MPGDEDPGGGEEHVPAAVRPGGTLTNDHGRRVGIDTLRLGLGLGSPRGELMRVFVALEEVELVDDVVVVEAMERPLGQELRSRSLAPRAVLAVDAVDEQLVVLVDLANRRRGEPRLRRSPGR